MTRVTPEQVRGVLKSSPDFIEMSYLPAWRAGRISTAALACSGCGERHPHRALLEATEDDLGVFEGERFCPPCAARVGVV